MPRVRSLVAAAVVPVAAVGAILWWLSRPPEIARLLPEAEAIVFADVRPIRLATHFDRELPARAADYQAFVDATGIVPERDLDQAAVAVTRRADPAGANGPVAYTELLSGHFDAARFEGYLRSLGPAATDSYAGHLVFTLHMADGGRDLRLAVVRPGLLAMSNTATPEELHAILDHARSPLFGASPSLLAEHFGELPRFSPVWAMGRLGLPFADGAAGPGAAAHVVLFGLRLPVSAEQTMLLSVRYVGSLRLRVEALDGTRDAALEQAAALTSLAGLGRTLLSAAPGHGPSPELAAALDSVRVEPQGTRAVLTATLPVGLLRELTGTARASR